MDLPDNAFAEEVKAFIYKLEEDGDYAIENYCPDDTKLLDIRRQYLATRKEFIKRVGELIKEAGLSDDEEIQAVMEELEEE